MSEPVPFVLIDKVRSVGSYHGIVRVRLVRTSSAGEAVDVLELGLPGETLREVIAALGSLLPETETPVIAALDEETAFRD